MYTKIVEAHLDPFWLKVIVGTYEPHEVAHNSALPGYQDLNLMRHCEKANPDDIWILDLSTGEGANFRLDEEAKYRIQDMKANL